MAFNTASSSCLRAICPTRQSGQCGFLVDALWQSGNANSTDQLTVDDKWHSAADEIDLAGVQLY